MNNLSQRRIFPQDCGSLSFACKAYVVYKWMAAHSNRYWDKSLGLEVSDMLKEVHVASWRGKKFKHFYGPRKVGELMWGNETGFRGDNEGHDQNLKF